MTAIIRKLRRKRKLSSELDSRWGDVSITYPTEGSWSQWDQPAGVVARSPERGRRHSSLDTTDRRSWSSPRHPVNRTSGDSSLTIPRGHYDSKLRNRSSKKIPAPLCATRDPPHTWQDSASEGPSSDASEDDDPVSELGPSRGRYPPAAKSPPLSITSKMRRCSIQSNTTDGAASMPATASSKHTSYTSTVPSTLSEGPPRSFHLPTHHEKIKSPRSPFVKAPPPPPLQLPSQLPHPSRGREPHRAPEVESAGQELVPSYEELYG